MALKDSRVLIIGGTSGIGLAVAQAAASSGATPIVASRKLANVTNALRNLPPRAEGLTVDLNDEDSITHSLPPRATSTTLSTPQESP